MAKHLDLIKKGQVTHASLYVLISLFDNISYVIRCTYVLNAIILVDLFQLFHIAQMMDHPLSTTSLPLCIVLWTFRLSRIRN